MRPLCRRKEKQQDLATFLGDSTHPKAQKQRLIEKCKILGVSIYIEDASEASSGTFSELRGVASEAELDRRLTAKMSVCYSKKANIIAIAALVVSVVSVVVAIYALNHK